MLSMSENFLRQAQSSGRQVSCRIEAGSEVYLDDRILEFDFDDIIHPDWFTLGSTCANRFSFSVKYGNELYVKDVVKPYISFDGEEWCPLGVFYVARRYVRGGYATITCYDRMYSLDMVYKTQLEMPSDTVQVLEDICTQYNLECADLGKGYPVKEIPENCTVRDMIGYIAGMNIACAKMDRSGALVLKKYGNSVFMLSDANCWGIQRNMERSVITSIQTDTGSETLISGSGAEISRLDMYNPLMTQERQDNMYSFMRAFGFYGAEIDMQGMPFLESGDRLDILDEGMLYPLIISEAEYHYECGLTMRLSSKNRHYLDAAVHTDDLAAALAEIKKSLGGFCLRQLNKAKLKLTQQAQIAADFEFETVSGAFAQLDVNITAENYTADEVVIDAYVNGTKAAHSGIQTMTDGRQLLHYCWLATELPKGKNRIYVTLKTTSGTAYVLPKMLLASVVGHGASGGGAGTDKLSFFEEFPGIPTSDMMFVPADMSAAMSAE